MGFCGLPTVALVGVECISKIFIWLDVFRCFCPFFRMIEGEWNTLCMSGFLLTLNQSGPYLWGLGLWFSCFWYSFNLVSCSRHLLLHNSDHLFIGLPFLLLRICLLTTLSVVGVDALFYTLYIEKLL